MTSFLDRHRLGVTAYREAYLTAGVIDTEAWSEQSARNLRYRILQAQYEQTSYRDVHTWAIGYRLDYGLYKDIRPVYNPAWRLGEFWKAHLFGGLLDPEAGETGAIPISTDNEQLRVAIANLWKWSRWNTRKDLLAIKGTILGDAVIQIRDDVNRGKVYLDLLYPGSLESVIKDPFGHVKGYVIQETRVTPDGLGAKYREEVSREGELTVYKTFKEGKPYAWPGNVDRTGKLVSEWREPYGFVPLVVLQHDDQGLAWGLSALHPIRAKVFEADDVASMITDSIRKVVLPQYKIIGMKKPTQRKRFTGATRDADDDAPAPGREEIQHIYVPKGGDVAPLTVPLDPSALVHLASLLKEIERDVIELSPDIHTASGAASGRALRAARQPVTSKVMQHRASYYAAMVAAQQMAVAIGGWRGYKDYEGFGLDSYERGDLDHSIADRPVFREDPLDQIEIDTAFWKGVEQANKGGVSTGAYLRLAGWDDERIAIALSQEETNAQPD